MLKVRNILTEILMSVTNDEMQVVVDETMANFRAKGTRCLSTYGFKHRTQFHFLYVEQYI